jgi:hypothetical protein
MAAGEMEFFTGEYDKVFLDLAEKLSCDEIRAIGARLGWDRALTKANTNWKNLSTTLIYKVEK